MTITLYLHKLTLLRDLKTLKIIFDAGIPELVIPLSGYIKPLDIAMQGSFEDYYSVAIQVTPEEFALIGVFQPSLIK